MKKEIVKAMHAQVLALREAAVRRCEHRNLKTLAEKYRSCKLFTGNESVEELADLLKSPQGVEFCLNNHFPHISTLRAFKEENLERFGIYIDSGSMTLNNPKTKVVVIGRTTATVNCSETRRYEIVAMHGAKVIVNASGWSVVSVESAKGCAVIHNIQDNAIIL